MAFEPNSGYLKGNVRPGNLLESIIPCQMKHFGKQNLKSEHDGNRLVSTSDGLWLALMAISIANMKGVVALVSNGYDKKNTRAPNPYEHLF